MRGGPILFWGVVSDPLTAGLAYLCEPPELLPELLEELDELELDTLELDELLLEDEELLPPPPLKCEPPPPELELPLL